MSKNGKFFKDPQQGQGPSMQKTGWASGLVTLHVKNWEVQSQHISKGPVMVLHVDAWQLTASGFTTQHA